MTTRKRIMIASLSATLLAAFLFTPVSADTQRQPAPVSGVVSSDRVLTPQEQFQHGIDEGWDTATMNLLSSKLNFMELTEEERTSRVLSDAPEARGFYAQHFLDVVQFEQERSYWCGPAVTKQTINFLSGGTINPSQTTLASILGTSTAGTASGRMNNYLSSQGYPYANVPTATMTARDLVNYVATDLDSYSTPPFGAVAISHEQVVSSPDTIGWHYSTDGHFINISGIVQLEPECEKSGLHIVDPYGTEVDASLDYYYVLVEQYVDVMTSFWW